MERLRIIVGCHLGLVPAGGLTWDYVQYPAGFADLGHDVYYVEDTRMWPIYQPEGSDWGDASASVTYLKNVMDDFDLSERWAYRDEASGQTFGMSAEQVEEICRTADLFVNVSCSTYMRDEYRAIPTRALIDTDPMFTQIQYLSQQMFTPGEPGLRNIVDAHNFHFTFGENIGRDDCRMPNCGINWLPTRQPVCLSRWPASELQQRNGHSDYTTLMNWTAAPPLEYEGETWGQKNIEFQRVIDLPHRTPEVPLAIAVGQTGGVGEPFPSEEASVAGWRVLDPQKHAPDWRSYRSFIESSRGEFSIAKETYVKGRTGWFSGRSACYMASGRPVVTQDTGWSRYLPTGEGLFAFDDIESAAAALKHVESDPAHHSRMARQIAQEHFDSSRVLKALITSIA